MKIKVLHNPYSNRWNSLKRWPEAASALKAAGVDFDLSVSEYADQLVDLAADAVKQDFTTIVAAGGDGTIGEIANGITKSWDGKSKFPAAIGILPFGNSRRTRNSAWTCAWLGWNPAKWFCLAPAPTTSRCRSTRREILI